MSHVRKKVELLTLSPVHVGTERAATLSPYSDYVFETNGAQAKLWYIDQHKLAAWLDRGKADELTRSIQQAMNNNRSEYTIGDFLARHGVPPAEMALRSVPIDGDPGRNQIYRHIHNAGRPYIPGSTIKGAIRSAVLYNLLTQTKNGNRLTETFWQKLPAAWQAYEDLERKKRERAERGQIRRAEQALREKTKPLNSAERFEADIFGRNPTEDAFKYLLVSDTSPTDYAFVRVADVARLHLKNEKRKKDAPQWREVLVQNLALTLALQLFAPRTQVAAELAFLRKQDCLALFQLLNEFSRAVIQRELNKLAKYDQLMAFYENLQHELETLAPGEAILRLGGGKTYFDNSIGLVLEQDARFQRLRKVLGLGKNPKTRRIIEGEFPVTRSFLFKGDEPVMPLGWVKLKIRNREEK